MKQLSNLYTLWIFTKFFNLTFILFLIACRINAQVPEQMSYQAVIRNSSDQLVKNTNIGIQISVLQGSVSGIALYIERQFPTTNDNGLVSIEIGKGTVVLGIFSNINWSNGDYFLKTEIDLNGGSNFTITGTSQLLSVPFALYAKTAESISGGITETDPTFFLSPANDITTIDILNWSKAYLWGNHRDEGYLKKFDEADPIFATSPAKAITASNVINWNLAYNWGNHAGLYRPISYIPAWNEISSNPFSIVTASNNQILKYNLITGKWENWTPNFLTSYTESDPVWNAASVNYYSKINLQTTGAAQINFGNLINKPTTIAGYGISNAVGTTGDQTIAGNKSFTGTTTVATPVNANDATNKAYVDAIKENIYNEMLDAGMNGIVTDVDGNHYKTIKIGNQIWMAENLRTTHYNDGNTIPLVMDNSVWSSQYGPAYCWYNNDEAYKNYGGLYTWYVVITNKICPVNWHVSGKEEWETLINYLGGPTVAGNKLKESGIVHWNSPNEEATNESGFTALPSGYRGSSMFYELGNYAIWWSSLGITEGFWTRDINCVISSGSRGGTTLLYGYTIRCVKN